jgi:hypothetical protein
MTSPFASSNSIITMYLEPILHPHFNSYINVITLSSMPSGPLSDMVKVMNFPKLSPFQQVGRFASPFATSATCIHVLLRYPKNTANASIKYNDSLMTAEDIPSVFSYLTSNGYTIEQSLSQMMFDSPVDIGGISTQRLSGNKKMICMFKYQST